MCYIPRPQNDFLSPQHGAHPAPLRRRDTNMSLHRVASGFVISIAFSLFAYAQGQAPAAPPKPDSPEVQAMLEKAKKTAGTQWADEEHFFCEAPRANAVTDPPIKPTKIFDNVSIIGNQGTAVYVVQTNAGLLMIASLPAANQIGRAHV